MDSIISLISTAMIPILLTALLIIIGLFLTSDCDLYLKFCSYNKKSAFKNKIIWIVGASSGIGSSLAMDLTKAGGRVIISARRKDLLEKVANDCSQYGLRPIIVVCDILQIESQQKAYQEIIQKIGHIDILVLSAGRGQRALAIDAPVKVHQELMQLNYFSFISMTNIVLPKMIENKSGHIVVISSLGGKVGTPISAAYSASKFALHGYYDALRAEVSSEYNIALSLVCPGPTDSEFGLHRLEGSGSGGNISSDGNGIEQYAPVKETKKMKTERCSHLIAKGMFHKVDEMWISRQPVLLVTYLAVYAPWITRQLFKYVLGPSRVQALRCGSDPYDPMKLLFGTAKKKR